jgi:hypothetical protein
LAVYSLQSIYYNTFMRTSYYTLNLQLRPGWRLPNARTLKITNGDLKGTNASLPVDPAKWKDPPHVAFANLGYDAVRRGGLATDDQIKMFTSRYGPLSVIQGQGAVAEQPKPSDRQEATKRVLAPTQAEEQFWLSLDNFRLLQAQLRAAWKEKNSSLFTDSTNSGVSLGYELLPVSWRVTGNQMEMCLTGCDDFMGVLLTRDLAEKRTRVCQNPDCPTPYFVAGRRDAKFCSHRCAVAIGVNNFRKRQRRKK